MGDSQNHRACPLCFTTLTQPDLCVQCGSLEGFSTVDEVGQVMMKRPSGRTFGFAWQRGSLAPFKCAPEQLLEKALDAIQVSKCDYVVEMGCGDGRMSLKAAKRGATVVGVDLDGGLLQRAVRQKDADGVEFLQQDIRVLDLTPFNVVIVFLLPAALDSPWLSKKLLSAVESGAKVLSMAWPVRALRKHEAAHIHYVVEPDLNDNEIPVTEFYVYDKRRSQSVKNQLLGAQEEILIKSSNSTLYICK